MRYEVLINKKSLKNILKPGEKENRVLFKLVEAIEEKGPEHNRSVIIVNYRRMNILVISVITGQHVGDVKTERTEWRYIMLVVVNQHRTDNFRIEGDISPSSLDMLKKYYGKSLHVENNSNDDEWVNIESTYWYKEIKNKYSPSSNLSFYRKEKKLTQTQLGALLGMPKQYVSDMEHDRRSISKAMAKKIALALDCPVSLFI